MQRRNIHYRSISKVLLKFPINTLSSQEENATHRPQKQFLTHHSFSKNVRLMAHKLSLPLFNAKQANPPNIPANVKTLSQRINSIDQLIQYISPFHTNQNSMGYTTQEFNRKHDTSTSPYLMQTPSVDIGSALKLSESKIPTLHNNLYTRSNRSIRSSKIKRFAKYNQIPMSAPLQINGSSFARIEKIAKDCSQDMLANTQQLCNALSDKDSKKSSKIRIKGFMMRRDKSMEYMRILSCVKIPKATEDVPSICFGSMIDRYRSQYNCKDLRLKALLQVQ